MELLRSSIQFMAAASLLLAAAQVYLTLNKLWKRKHEPAVAESISIMGEFVGLVPLFFLTLNFMLQGSWEGTVDGVFWLGAGSVSIAIGTGMWVEGRRGRGFFTLLKEALALERGEVERPTSWVDTTRSDTPRSWDASTRTWGSSPPWWGSGANQPQRWGGQAAGSGTFPTGQASV
jgi:hypothetical protein